MSIGSLQGTTGVSVPVSVLAPVSVVPESVVVCGLVLLEELHARREKMAKNGRIRDIFCPDPIPRDGRSARGP
jgi:hypothetical protein